MPQNSNNNSKQNSKPNNNSQSKPNNNSQSKPNNNNSKPNNNNSKTNNNNSKTNNNSQSKPNSQSKLQQVRQNTEQDGGLKFFDKMKNKYTDWRTRRTIIKEAEVKAEKAVALNKFNRLKSQYGFKGGEK